MGARVPPVGRELVDRNPANINHRLSLHGHHAEHARADRVATDLQNLSGCFHPHFAGVTIPGHFVTGYRQPRVSPFTGYSRPRLSSTRTAGATIAGRLL